MCLLPFGSESQIHSRPSNVALARHLICHDLQEPHTSSGVCYPQHVPMLPLQDAPAKDAHAKFVKAVKNAEAVISKRNSNRSPTSRATNPADGGLPYTLLLPSSQPGRTGRGIPYSTSI